MKFQIPSDLLTYDREKVDPVKENVKAVLDVIETMRMKKLEEESQHLNALMFSTESQRISFPRRLKWQIENEFVESVDSIDDNVFFTFEINSSAADRIDSHIVEEMGLMDEVMVNDVDEESLPSLDQENTSAVDAVGNLFSETVVDFTAIPKKLDKILEQYDADIEIGNVWSEFGRRTS